MAVIEPIIDVSDLALASLMVNNFRGFERLQIPRLGRVNLITGRNNSGKSSLLEAILLYTRRGSPQALLQTLQSRDQLRAEASASNAQDMSALIAGILYLFHNVAIGKAFLAPASLSIEASPDQSQNSFEFQLYWPDPLKSGQPGISTRVPGHSVLYDATRILETQSHPFFEPEGATPCRLVTAYGPSRLQLGELWDKVSLSRLKGEVLNALRLIESRIDDLNFLGDVGSGQGRVPFVLLKSQEEPFPLSLLGDGMNRLFGLILALANTQNGVLLVDEIETGLHYSVLHDVWRRIFRFAHASNVQVFATTHSWDCIEAFQKASEEDAQNEGVLVRLENKFGDVKATVFDERRLAIVTREQIEVR